MISVKNMNYFFLFYSKTAVSDLQGVLFIKEKAKTTTTKLNTKIYANEDIVHRGTSQTMVS